jgi:hypothetical protein
VLGPGDKPPVHDPTKGLIDKNDNGVNKLFTPSRVKLTGHVIKLTVYRAEHLAPLDLMDISVDPFVKVSFAGAKCETTPVYKNRNPEFNQELSLACRLPTMNNMIKVEMWDDNMLSDERVGTFCLNFNDIKNQSFGPRWINFYGPPVLPADDLKKEYADLMTLQGEKGSTYRGRMLYSIETQNSENPRTIRKDLKFDVRSNPSPNVRVKSYILKLALYEGVELPVTDKEYYIVASCGPYEVISKPAKCVESIAAWN